MADHSGSPPFVGRQRELTQLLARLAAAEAGQGGVALVGGEPGIGKTRLLLELAGCARAQGWQILMGRAYQAEGMPSYLPFKEALREYVRACPAEELRGQLGKGAAEVALLVPEVQDRLADLPHSPPLAADYERYRLFESVTDFLLAIAGSSRPGALVVLDDLHAADRPALLLLQHLARKLAATPLLVVGTYRTVDVEHPHPLQDLLAELSREELHQRLLLGALSVEAVAVMVEGMVGVPAAPSVAEAICRETGGNPFFVREVVRHLQAEERDLADARTAGADWGIPEGIRHVIGRRLSRLSREAGRMLQAAAVLGDGFGFDVLTAVSGLEEGPLLDALEETLRAGVVREEGTGYHFSHALIRDALYGELPLPRRQRLHLRAAEVMERVHNRHPQPYLAIIATHYRLAGAAADPATVLDHVQRAGAAAAAVFAWEEAATHLQAAVDLLEEMGADTEPEPAARRCELLLELGRIQGRAGNVQRARESFRQAAVAARQLGASEQLAQAALGYGEVYVTGSDVDAFLVDLLNEALAALDDSRGIGAEPRPEGVGEGEPTATESRERGRAGPSGVPKSTDTGREFPALRAKVLAGLAMALRYAPDAEGRASLVREAVATARRSGDRVALAFALSAMHVAHWRPGNVSERLAAATEAVHLAEQNGDRDLACWGHHWRAIDLLELGDIAALDEELEAHRRVAEELRAPYSIWNSLRLRAMRAIMEGAFADGERLALEALEIGRRVDPVDAHAMFTTQIWNVRLWQGRLEELVADWERYCEYYQAIPAWRARLAWLYTEIGRSAEAQRELERLAPDGFAALPQEMHWLSAVTFLAEACYRLRDTDHAATLYELLLPYAGYNVRSGGYPVSLACFGSASRPLGMLAATLGRWDAAMHHFEDAISMNTRMQAWPWVADARHAYAVMLLARHARGDLARARAHLEQALTLYDQLGMEHYAAGARTLLAAPHLAAAPLSPPAYPDHLTPREVDVLRLIAAGRSNREIAQALVVSERTVERHIANIYAKIGVGGRAARVAATVYALGHHLAEPAADATTIERPASASA
jgi:DNA-binding NarL/FixJ family response regulator